LSAEVLRFDHEAPWMAIWPLGLMPEGWELEVSGAEDMKFSLGRAEASLTLKPKKSLRPGENATIDWGLIGQRELKTVGSKAPPHEEWIRLGAWTTHVLGVLPTWIECTAELVGPETAVVTGRVTWPEGGPKSKPPAFVVVTDKASLSPAARYEWPPVDSEGRFEIKIGDLEKGLEGVFCWMAGTETTGTVSTPFVSWGSSAKAEFVPLVQSEESQKGTPSASPTTGPSAIMVVVLMTVLALFSRALRRRE
jgi:hypothetical protein